MFVLIQLRKTAHESMAISKIPPSQKTLSKTISHLGSVISSRQSNVDVKHMEISPLDKRRQNAIDEFVKRATQAYGDRIRGITLFGSVARGTPHRDSDIDLLVVIDKEDFRLRRELTGLAFDIFMETGGDLSVKVLSSQDFQARKSFSFLRNVLTEGIKVA